MRLALTLAALALAACQSRPSAESPTPTPADIKAAPSPLATPGAPAASPTPAATPTPPSVHELAALGDYAGFSADGLLYAYTVLSSGAGLQVVTFVSTTTDTVEKTVPLENDAVRRQVIAEMDEEGFPRPGRQPEVPKQIGARILENDQVIVTFGGAPAGSPFKPFKKSPGLRPHTAEVTAVSLDGKLAAVRVIGSGTSGTEFGQPVEHHVVRLFE